MLKLAIILPTLNERDNLAPLVRRLADALDGPLGADGWEAIFVDDNSQDGTAEEARTLSCTDSRVRVIQRIGRRGLASAAIEGMMATAAPLLAVMDADHQHDPALLPQMVAALESGEADVCVASRFAPGASMAEWNQPTREKQSELANRIARRLTGVTLTDPMSGYFMLRAATLRVIAPKLSGIGFKILLDILATSDTRLTVREFPLAFAARASGESKLDQAIAFEFLVGLYDKTLGRFIPTRFALFGTIGAMGVVVHLAVLATLFRWMGTSFIVGQISAVIAAMTFNFILNNELTYADKRLKHFGELLVGWGKFCLTCLIGAFANVGVAEALVDRGVHWVVAAMAGIIIGSVWNYALSSRFVWGRF
ncbi:glycosyltransferase family 2 protein [Croceicoccus naphthovorans]|uniref:Dolichol monophosphate mannose synthase n=1 Tax=Croceicoccus naphthovorans TaxID=1348774 RepID=A0A0G3XG46_9SPHN|nr:glycosyltransferase family 2 protein [Croceicoccus naphthovorans]AKM09569.1 dolichol monophosphate mannose synthase [Croceicoccus naphthovorans]MBB3989664.1 dolichol-phosphate mannosyltransferase [Croceicoccus naphthovorans]